MTGEVLCSLHAVKAVNLINKVIKMQDLAFFNQLKEFTIELWGGSNGIKLARYILEHAQNLEKMVVVHLQEHSDVERFLSQSKVISNATLVIKSVPYYSVDTENVCISIG
ncbi:putative FBD domain-containing protein [Rosa chinensis]|uniref:Putative FBD domain-containing protein n=1 Tax=Rosa chinensis TaxID=74649 RepID=A0A2P6RC24_ROSCH|nr:putative FBD domain-containing protein [Rosa chinensis]